MKEILHKLKGGTIQSKGNVADVVRDITQNPSVLSEIVTGLQHSSKVVRFRCTLVLKEVAEHTPDFSPLYKKKILEVVPLAAHYPELKWHLPLVFHYLELEEEEVTLILQTLEQWLREEEHRFVKVNCLQALANFAQKHTWFKQEAQLLIEAQMQEGSASIKARGRKLLKQLSTIQG